MAAAVHVCSLELIMHKCTFGSTSRNSGGRANDLSLDASKRYPAPSRAIYAAVCEASHSVSARGEERTRVCYCWLSWALSPWSFSAWQKQYVSRYISSCHLTVR